MSGVPGRIGGWLATGVLLSLTVGCAVHGAHPVAPGRVSSHLVAPDDEGGWETTITPYLWTMGLDGDITIKGNTASMDVGFTDLLRSLDYGGQVHIETRRGDWAFFVNPSFFALSEDGNLGPIGLEGDLSILLGEAGVMHRVGEWQTDEGRAAELDLLAGIRHMNVDATLNLSAPGPMGIGTKLAADKGWTDPIVGARYIRPLSESARLMVQGDVGGFGVGSDFTWNLMALVSHEQGDGQRLWFGYRILDIDYSDGSGTSQFALDAQMRGLLFGWQFPF